MDHNPYITSLRIINRTTATIIVTISNLLLLLLRVLLSLVLLLVPRSRVLGSGARSVF